MKQTERYLGKKLLLIGDNLVNGQGGVEHVLCNMANVMDDCGLDVSIATIESRKGHAFYNLKVRTNLYLTNSLLSFNLLL